MTGSSGAAAASARQRSRSRGDGEQRKEDPIAKHVCHKEVPHFQVLPGELLGPQRRYYVRRLLGEGTFGRVLSCVDTVRKEAVAVKVVKGVRKYCDYAEAEAEALKQILMCDPGRQSHCVQLRDTFLHHGIYFCLVFERLGVSLHDFMWKECCKGLLAADVQRIAQQLLQCLSFLHGLSLTHTDLKCRNVMLRDPRYNLVDLPRVKGATTRKPHSSEVVVIDFGGALFAAERGDGKIGTRHYRAPEVVMGLPWDEKADMWSAGCLIALAYLGFRPISAAEDFEQLALMERFIGKEIARSMARQAINRGSVPNGVVFNKSGRLEWPRKAPSVEAVQRVEALQPLHAQVSSRHTELLDLLQGLLQCDSKLRLSAAAAAESPFATSRSPIQE